MRREGTYVRRPGVLSRCPPHLLSARRPCFVTPRGVKLRPPDLWSPVGVSDRWHSHLIRACLPAEVRPTLDVFQLSPMLEQCPAVVPMLGGVHPGGSAGCPAEPWLVPHVRGHGLPSAGLDAWSSPEAVACCTAGLGSGYRRLGQQPCTAAAASCRLRRGTAPPKSCDSDGGSSGRLYSGCSVCSGSASGSGVAVGSTSGSVGTSGFESGS